MYCNVNEMIGRDIQSRKIIIKGKSDKSYGSYCTAIGRRREGGRQISYRGIINYIRKIIKIPRNIQGV